MIEKKKAVTLNIPPRLAEEFDVWAEEVNGKQKWMMFCAASLLYAAAGEMQRKEFIALAAATDAGARESWDRLLKLAAQGDFRFPPVVDAAAPSPSAVQAGGVDQEYAPAVAKAIEKQMSGKELLKLVEEWKPPKTLKMPQQIPAAALDTKNKGQIPRPEETGRELSPHKQLPKKPPGK